MGDRNQWHSLTIKSLTAGMVIVAVLVSDRTIAQIVPDDTLGSERSVVTSGVTVRGVVSERIDGGATRGTNLFHSFQEFNVNEGQRVYFSNPAGVENILSRVTGNNISNILGTLGVDGVANLFLLNPNGIIFGPNARLDVSGSFVGTTANSFTFPDGSEFSATNPQAPPLLAINVPVGLQYGTNTTGTITNTGNLAAGQGLTLSANTLDLQGQLQAGSNLTLQAQDTVRIRDSATAPFIAASQGQMLVQGDRTVDIFALNHPSSGLFSGGDMVLRSANQVGGDAHYWTGSNFRIDQLDGSLGNLYSPYDPVIRALGDVSFSLYRGASLHILAGGSVEFFAATITAPETSNDGISSLQENIQLSNGNQIIINGNTQPTLDVRAGIDPSQVGVSGVTGAETDVFFFGNPILENTSTSANISIGDIRITAPNGLVFLTNQYKPNSSLVNGDINVVGFFTGGIYTNNSIGDSSSIILDSRNNITLSDSVIVSASAIADAGDITLLAAENITINGNSALNASAFGQGNAGNILVRANNSVILSNGAFIGSNLGEEAEGQGGNISVYADSFSISDGAFLDASTFGKGDAGSILLDVNNDISLGTGSLIFNNIEANAIGNSGGIRIEARSLSLNENSQITSSVVGQGRAGNISIQATDAVILTGTINDPLNPIATTAIGSRIEPGGGGTGGDVIVNTGRLSLSGAQISASTLGTGNSGRVFIQATNSVALNNDASVFSTVGSGAVGNGGGINLDTGTLSIVNSGLLTIVRRGDDLIPAGRGDAGDINISVRDAFTFSGADPGTNGTIVGTIASAIDAGAIGNAGDINIRAGSFSMTDAAQVRSTLDQGAIGTAGDISVQVQSLSLSSGSQLNTFSAGQGDAGDIYIQARNGISLVGNGTAITDTAINSEIAQGGVGQGGDITIESGSLSLTDGAQLATFVRDSLDGLPAGQGTAGDVNINVNGAVIVDGVSSDNLFSAITSRLGRGATGEGGDINIRAGSLLINNGARLDARTIGQGNSGNINLNILADITLRGIPGGTSSEILSTVDSEAIGRGGNINIQAETVSLLGNAGLSSSTSGNGRAGDLRINARNSVSLDGEDASLVSITSGQQRAGDLIITTQEFMARDGAFVSTSTGGIASAGNLILQVSNSSQIIDSILSTATLGAGNAGNLEITTRRLTIRDGGYASSGTFSGSSGRGGNLTINASELVKVIGTTADGQFASGLVTETDGSGNAGDIRISTRRLNVRGGGTVSGETSATGNGGNLTIAASDLVEIDGGAPNNQFSSSLSAETEGFGDAGNIDIVTDRLIIRGGGFIASSAREGSTGDAGNVTINAFHSISLIGRTPNGRNPSGISVAVENNAWGNAGNLDIFTRNLSLYDGGSLLAQNFGRGQGGTLRVRALNSIELANDSVINAVTGPNATEQAGDLRIDAQNLRVLGGSSITASTFGRVDAGNIQIRATDSVEVSGSGRIPSQISASSLPFVRRNPGQGGNLSVETGRLILSDGGQINVSTEGAAQAGDIELSAQLIRLENQSQIIAQTRSGNGGNLILQNIEHLLLRNGSRISTNAGIARAGGNGGNISINADLIIAVPQENSDITANAFTGSGGRVEITTQGLFGITPREFLTPFSDITASSAQGIQGVVAVSNPDVDPSRGLAELPVDVTDATQQIAQNCPTGGTTASELGEFVVTGRGGLPPSPTEVLGSETVLTQLADTESLSSDIEATTNSALSTQTVASLAERHSTPSTDAIAEAQSWVIDADGQVTLVAHTPQSPSLIPSSCTAAHNPS
jgi:filamentous hemagglutinin family protein